MQVVSLAIHAGVQVFWKGPREIAQKSYNKGIIRILYDWGSDEGVEKLYKMAIWTFKLLGDNFKAAAHDIKIALDVAYGTMLFKSVAKSFVDEKRYRFKLPERKNLTSSILQTLGSACRFVDFLTKGVKLISIPVLGKISDRLGQYKVFQYQPLSFLANRPHDFFFLFASLASSTEIVVQNYLNIRAGRGGVQDILSPLNILSHISNMGKVTLICFGHFAMQPWYIAVAGVSNVAGLLRVTIK